MDTSSILGITKLDHFARILRHVSPNPFELENAERWKLKWSAPKSKRYTFPQLLHFKEAARSHKSRATVDYTLIGVEPHGPTRGVWPIAAVANDSQSHLVASSI